VPSHGGGRRRRSGRRSRALRQLQSDVIDVDGGGGGARRRNRGFRKDFGNSGSNLPFNKPFDVSRIHGACRAKMTGTSPTIRRKEEEAAV
jgi:hypothetical protein